MGKGREYPDVKNGGGNVNPTTHLQPLPKLEMSGYVLGDKSPMHIRVPLC